MVEPRETAPRRYLFAGVVTLICAYAPHAWLPIRWGESQWDLLTKMPVAHGLFPSILLKQVSPVASMIALVAVPILLLVTLTIVGARGSRSLLIGSTALLLLSSLNAYAIHLGMKM